MLKRFCERCQQMVPLGVHPCIQTTPNKVTPNKIGATPNISADVAQPAERQHAKLEAVSSNLAVRSISSGRGERDKRYREAHKDKRADYQREYMRKRRSDNAHRASS